MLEPRVRSVMYVINMVSMYGMSYKGRVAVVVAELLLRVSDILLAMLLALSLLSLSLSASSGRTVVQHVSSLGLLRIYLFTRLTNNPAQIGTIESVNCVGIIHY